MAIKRNKQIRNYVEIPNATVQDTSLSWEARGLLTFMLSKPEDFKIMPSYLVKCGNAGRDKIHKLLNELESNGYLVSNQNRKDGKYGKSDYTVYDKKQTIQEYKDLEPCPENQLSVKQVESESSTNVPCPEMPYTAKPTLINTEKKKEQKSISKAESSADFDLIFLFVLTELQKTVCDFVQDDESLVRAKVGDYIQWCLNRSVSPGKGGALGFVKRGLGYEASADYNSAKIHQAKDKLTTAKTNRINASAEKINQLVNGVSRDRNDRSWDDGMDLDF